MIDLAGVKNHVLLCNGDSCMIRGGEELTQALRDEIALAGAQRSIHTTRTRCNGHCADGCVAIVYPAGVWYGRMTPEDGRALVRRLKAGEHLDSMAFHRM
nr:(2Fe-2S) ferredoxin domain-containing protein [Paenibacillus alkalitolerans]